MDKELEKYLAANAGEGIPRGEITEFLLARYAEDEDAARATICRCGGPACTIENGWMGLGEARARLEWDPLVEYAMRFTPARVVRDLESKRAIVEDAAGMLHMFEGPYEAYATIMLRHLATAYSDHPDYREEWRP